MKLKANPRAFAGVPASYDWDAFFNGNPIQKYWKRSIAQRVWEFAPHQDFRKVLDIGCGSSPIIRQYFDSVGVDIDPDKIDWMTDAHPDTHGNLFYEVDLTQDKGFFDTDLFDAVLCIEVLEHTETQPMLQAIAHHLKSGGVAVIATPDYDKRLWNLIEWAYKRLRPGQYCDDHHYPMSYRKLRGFAAAAGLSYVAHKYVARCDLVIKFVKN